MLTTAAGRRAEASRNLFASNRLPKELVTHTGPQFASGEFESFIDLIAVKHISLPAYHPASKGVAGSPSGSCCGKIRRGGGGY